MSRTSSLVINLHGGGAGGEEAALSAARGATTEIAFCDFREGCVLLAPVARKHVTDSWGTRSNFEDLLDAMEETFANFYINRKRIFITGQSMGGGGTSLYYLCFPEMAAGYCARAGFYFRDSSVKDVLEKSILIIQGEKDEPFRIQSKDDMVKQVRQLHGDLHLEILPGVDHFVPNDTAWKMAMPLFEKAQNTVEPDLRVLRAAGRSYFK